MSQDRYVLDAQGNQSLVKPDGTYVKLKDGRNRYLKKGSNKWQDIDDPNSLEAIYKMDSRFGEQKTNLPPITKNPSGPIQSNPNLIKQIPIPKQNQYKPHPRRGAEEKYRMSQLKDITGDLVGSVAQYANNMKAQRALDKVAVPLPTLSGMLESNKFNNNVELSSINNNLANDNAFAQNKFSDSQTSAAMRGAARTSALNSIAESNAKKNNIDAQNQYDANKINLGTTMQNNALMQGYKNTVMNKELSSIQAKQGFRNSLFGGFDNARKAEQVRQDNEVDAAIKTAAYSSENRDYLAGILRDKGVRAGYRLKNGGVIPKGKSAISKMYC